MHRKAAWALFRQGAFVPAYQELLKAALLAPMSSRLAALLVAIALKAGAVTSALRLITNGLDDTEGDEQLAIRRQLVRLLRRSDRASEAVKHLNLILQENRSDRRALRILEALGELPDETTELEDVPALQAKIRRDPLKSGLYRRMVHSFEVQGNLDRAVVVSEVAAALEQRPSPERLPRLMLDDADRFRLQHRYLDNGWSEMLQVAGHSLMRVLAPSGARVPPVISEFDESVGPGTDSLVEALCAGVRTLGIRPAKPKVIDTRGAPFSTSFDQTPRLWIARSAIEKKVSAAQLRFFLGRALWMHRPELLILRSLNVTRLVRAFRLLRLAAEREAPRTKAVETLQGLLGKQGLRRVRELYAFNQGKKPAIERMVEGARHSANRAGLVVCGAVSPALKALKAKHASEREVSELLRFASSEAYAKVRRRSY